MDAEAGEKERDSHLFSEDEMARRGDKGLRIFLLAMAFILAFSAVTAKLVYLQLVKADEYRKLAEEQRNHLLELKPRRGRILDRNGEVLAHSMECYNVYAISYLVKDVQKASSELSLALKLPRQELESKIRSSRGFVYLARKVDVATAESIKSMGLEGIGLEKDSKRVYPNKELACHVLGYVGTDNVGLSGLELQYEDLLAGKRGKAAMELDARGEPIPGVTRMLEEPEDGKDIHLTLDAQLQFKLQDELEKAVAETGAAWGAALVMDAWTGEILAMGVYPDFDLNRYPEVKAELTRNRSVTDAFEPGSVLKMATALACLDARVISPSTVLHVPPELRVGSSTFRDDHPMPRSDLTFDEVIAQSSNVGTIKAAQMLGKEGMYRFLSRLGLGKATGVDFPGENSGRLPALGGWSETTLPTVAIGQGVAVSQLQLAVLTAAVANGGRLVRPHFLKSAGEEGGGEAREQGDEGDTLCSPEAAASLRKMLGDVVTFGTGTRAAMVGYNCGGKTGTAMKPSPKGGYSRAYMASFAGFAPLEDPRLVAVITLDDPSPVYGGLTAAPCFSGVMEFALQRLGVPLSLDKVNTKDLAGKKAR